MYVCQQNHAFDVYVRLRTKGYVTMKGPTSDHREILEWSRRHDAHPAQKKPLIFDSEPAILHFYFGKDLESEEILTISWNAFFAPFTLMGLSLAFDETPDFEILQIEEASLYRKTAEGLV